MTDQSMYTMTPGSAVADSIQEILARRRLDARQAMLDKLNAENIHSEMAAREANTGMAQAHLGLAQSAEARAKAMNDEQLFGEKLKTLPEEGGDMSGADPELLHQLVSRHLIQTQAAQPAITGDQPLGNAPTGPSQNGSKWEAPGGQPFQGPVRPDVPAQPERQMYIGSPKHQAEESKKRDLDTLQADPALLNKSNPIGQAIAAAKAGINLPGEVLGPDAEELFIDPVTKQVTRLKGLGYKSHVNVLPMPPQANAANTKQMYTFEDPNQKGTYKSYWLMPGEQPSERNQAGPGPAAGHFEPKPATNSKGPGWVPPKAWDAYKATFGAMTGTSQDQRTAIRGQAKANIKALAIQNGISPQVINDLDQILAFAEPRMEAGTPIPPIQKLIDGDVWKGSPNKRAGITGITDPERAQLSSLLQGFIGQ